MRRAWKVLAAGCSFALARLDREVPRLADDGHELFGAGDGFDGRALDDEPRCRGVGFIAEFEEGIGEVLLGDAGEEAVLVGRGWGPCISRGPGLR